MFTKLRFFLILILMIILSILYIEGRLSIKNFKLNFLTEPYTTSMGYILPYIKFRGYTMPTKKEPYFTLILNTKELHEKFEKIDIPKNILLDYSFSFIKKIKYTKIEDNVFILEDSKIKLILPKSEVYYTFDLHQNKHTQKLIIIHTISDKVQKGIFAYILLN